MNILKSRILVISLLTAALLSLTVYKAIKKNDKKDFITIGVLQTASHPSLDDARESFIQLLKSKLGDSKVKFVVQNAEGSIQQAQTIAESFHANSDIFAIYAIATPALSVLHNIEKSKPIIFSAVSSPSDLGITKSDANIAGVSDKVNTRDSSELIKQLLPNIKKVSLLYNRSELNSLSFANEMKDLLVKEGIETIDSNISSPSDILVAVNVACEKADAIISPSDNTVAVSLDLIAEIAKNKKKPFIATFEQSAHQGALAGFGVDYKKQGIAAAEILVSVLNGKKKISEVGIIYPKIEKIVVNKTTLDSLDLSVPESLKKKISFIN